MSCGRESAADEPQKLMPHIRILICGIFYVFPMVIRFGVCQRALLQSCPLVQTEHDVHVLDRCAGSALAQVVEEGGDTGLLVPAVALA